MRAFRRLAASLVPLAACAPLLIGAASGGCAREAGAPVIASRGAVHASGATAGADPTVYGARLVPEAIDEERAFGIEPGGGLRAIAAGVRVVSLPSGAVLAAEDRLPSSPAITTPLPARLGGGFLFVLGNVVWRADRWLAPARPIHRSNLSIARVIVGLDRVYLRAQSGAHQAIDPRTGAALDLGPWPGSSYVGAYASADGWRAVAIDDLRGVVATFDAGATWRPLRLPIDAREVLLDGDAIAVGGHDAARASAWFEVRADGQVGRLAAPPAAAASAPTLPLATAATTERASQSPLEGGASKAFGRRPLVAAIEDGWPLADGTAVVARDGALARVRLADGALVEVAADAYPLKPSRCHPLPAGRPGDPGAFVFACGEPRGATVIYAYDAPSGRMIEAKRFDAPRVVLSSGNGAIVVRGPCAPGGVDDDPSVHTYCRHGPRDVAWTDVFVRGAIGGERVVLLADGRFVILSPPQRELGTARLTILDAGQGRSVAVDFPPLSADVARVLKMGVWLDGFEERRPGVVGGWIEAGGSMLGIEIALDGRAKVGEFVREAGAPMVSGRYGLGWTASRRGYETIDGGMTWTPLDVPEPIAQPRAVSSRACGPIGCTAAGWIRVGWEALEPNDASASRDAAVAGPLPRGSALTNVALACESTSAPAPSPPDLVTPRPPLGHVSPTGGAPAAPVELPAFYTLQGPPLRADERGLSYETSDLLERHVRLGPVAPVARVYAWGPRSGEWEHASKWIARWLWPYGSAADVRASQAVAAPQSLVDVARFGAAGGSIMMPPTWSVAVGDDATHALLIGRRSARADATLYELEADRAPIEVRRADGDPFTEIDAALRAGGRWYVATPPQQGELMASVIWQIDGPLAREIARIPRAGMDARPTGAHLARRSDGRAIALVVDGQPTAERSAASRWVVPIDVDSGAVGEPESLGSSDLGDRAALPPCSDDFAGWILDTPLTTMISLAAASASPGARAPSAAPATASASIAGSPVSLGVLSSVLARVRLTQPAACIERLAGTLDGFSTDRLARVPRAASASAASGEPSLSVSVFAARARYALRCTRR